MKQIVSLLLSLFLIVAFSGCHNSVDTGDMPPMIDMYGQKYVAPNMPVNELPQGYTYLGELSKEQANGTGLEGCKMYAVTELNSIPDFYLYQECGTPIDDNTVDSEKIQWAYVQWQYSCDPRHRLIQQSYELNFQFRGISDTLAVLTGKKFQVLILLLH